LRAFNNAADGSLRLALGVKIDEKKDHHPIYLLGKMCGDMILYLPAFVLYLQVSHQFSRKIQAIIYFVKTPYKDLPKCNKNYIR
jgi:hypothetical protein